MRSEQYEGNRLPPAKAVSNIKVTAGHAVKLTDMAHVHRVPRHELIGAMLDWFERFTPEQQSRLIRGEYNEDPFKV